MPRVDSHLLKHPSENKLATDSSYNIWLAYNAYSRDRVESVEYSGVVKSLAVMPQRSLIVTSWFLAAAWLKNFAAK